MAQESRFANTDSRRNRISASALYRWAAAALAVSGISLAVGMVLHPPRSAAANIGATRWAVSHLFWWFGALAGIAGIAGLYLRLRRGVGVLGCIGGGLGLLGLTLILSTMFFEAFIAPPLAARAPEIFEAYPAGGGWQGFLAGVLASGALFGVGFLVLGIAMIRAGSMPRWAILLALLGGIPFAVNFLLPRGIAILAVTIFAVGLSGLGYALWHRAGQRTLAARQMPGEA